tara:strand:- start:23 stop:640 length:618 start_codon:yes stop_codon:yes gene_type:complete
MIINLASGAQNGTLLKAFSEDPSQSYFDVHARSYLKTAEGQKDANFKARYEAGGVNGVLTATQQHYKNQVTHAFEQLYGIELDLLPNANTKREVLEGYYEELTKNKSKKQVKNVYTEKVVINQVERLKARIQQLQPHAIGGTLTRQCWKDGKHDLNCVAEFVKAHGKLPDGSSNNNATSEILLQTLGVGKTTDTDKGVEMEMEQR